MTDDVAFLERTAWLDEDGSPKYKTFCPVSYSQRFNRLTAGDRKVAKFAGGSSDEKLASTSELSALEQQFDWPLHQMVGYMRRLDGALGRTIRGLKYMDPMAPDKEPKHAFDGSRTPYFGFWFYLAWYNVIVPSLQKTFGPILNVMDMDDLEDLLEAKVMM
jgi:hypothetical protein